MSAIFHSAGGSPSATTIGASSAVRVAVGELPDEFPAQLITVFEKAASIEFAWAELPVQLRGLTANPPIVYSVSFAVIKPESLPHRVMGHRSRLCRVEGPPAAAAEAGGAGGRSRAEVRGGVQRAQSSSQKAPPRRMGRELRAEIAAAAGAMAEGKQARERASSPAAFKAALVEREEAFDREAVAYFVFTDQADYDGAGHGGGSDDSSEACVDGGREGGGDYAGVDPI